MITLTVNSLAMIKPFVTKLMRAILACMTLFVVAACGQKGPLEPQPLPEQNQPAGNENQSPVESVTNS